MDFKTGGHSLVEKVNRYYKKKNRTCLYELEVGLWLINYESYNQTISISETKSK